MLSATLPGQLQPTGSHRAALRAFCALQAEHQRSGGGNAHDTRIPTRRSSSGPGSRRLRRCGARPAARGCPDQRRCWRDDPPAFLHYLDVRPLCCPAFVWGAVGSGRWRAHVDYLRSTREGVTVHETNVLAAWRFLEGNGTRAALLFGANMRRGIRHQVGAALDWPVERRFFVRVDARLVLFASGSGPGSDSESSWDPCHAWSCGRRSSDAAH